ncbi:MAG: penicillin-binding transpeptidase domain-containing protein, partial [Eubacteriales bacterium]|nr:penicillin-binding transpeptidase domain-containing protein [Eubacteriales bacterium]
MRPKRARYVVLALIIIGIFSVIALKMYDLQILAYEDYQQAASTKTTRTITLTGRRGTIYDANMIPLAYDKPAFDVQFYRDPSLTGDDDRAAYTQSIIDTIALIERSGKRTVIEFWLKKGEDGTWRFDTGTDNPAVAAKREKQWRQNFYLENVSEAELFDRLCANYKIPASLDDDMKVKVLSVWQLSRMYNFLSMPVVIAKDVGFDTVSELETRSLELIGMSIKQSSVRVYPKGQTAAHVVGYISKISGEETLANYKEKGYSNDATMGQTGIEYSMEDQLTPYMEYRKGQRVVEINNRGKIIREISYQAPIDGNSIVLTIDSRLQQVTEAALYKAIEGINRIQADMMNDSRWRSDNQEELLRYESIGKKVETATSGAIVVMAPDSGRIMAMASHPTIDLSRFTGGQVAPEYWNELVKNPDNPLYNRAISARDTPGSCFKMVTALAALVEGKLTLDEKITDKSPFTLTDDKSHQPSCWISKANRYKHADQTVVEGIKNSCNYFFFTVGL